MKIGIVILCRSTSIRLPGKHFRLIHGRSVLGHIMDRLRRGVSGHEIVVSTSSEASDDELATLCRRACYPCFRGSLDDVAGRFMACAEYHEWDYVASINGNNLFADPGRGQGGAGRSALLAI